jgi:hypothetical protein
VSWVLFDSCSSLTIIGIDFADHSMGRGNNPIQGAGINCEGFSVCEAGPSCLAKEFKMGSSKLPSNVSSRVRYGKWNFYAVRRGHAVGIFRTWPECEKQVKYYSGDIFKGFNTEEEANSFLSSY